MANEVVKICQILDLRIYCSHAHNRVISSMLDKPLCCHSSITA
jgi:hypothetical protein